MAGFGFGRPSSLSPAPPPPPPPYISLLRLFAPSLDSLSRPSASAKVGHVIHTRCSTDRCMVSGAVFHEDDTVRSTRGGGERGEEWISARHVGG